MGNVTGWGLTRQHGATREVPQGEVIKKRANISIRLSMPADRGLIRFSCICCSARRYKCVNGNRAAHIKGLEREEEPKIGLVNVKKGCY